MSVTGNIIHTVWVVYATNIDVWVLSTRGKSIFFEHEIGWITMEE